MSLFDKLTIEDVESWADSRETSIEISREILKTGADSIECERIWNSPTEKETSLIVKNAFKSTDDDSLFWGCETFTRN